VIFYLKETIVVPRKMTINSRVCNMSLHWSTYCLYYMIIYIYIWLYIKLYGMGTLYAAKPG
jgi:hypothetical protein